MNSNKISGFCVMYKRNIHKNKFTFCQLSTYSSFHTPAVTAMREPCVLESRNENVQNKKQQIWKKTAGQELVM